MQWMGTDTAEWGEGEGGVKKYSVISCCGGFVVLEGFFHTGYASLERDKKTPYGWISSPLYTPSIYICSLSSSVHVHVRFAYLSLGGGNVAHRFPVELQQGLGLPVFEALVLRRRSGETRACVVAGKSVEGKRILMTIIYSNVWGGGDAHSFSLSPCSVSAREWFDACILFTKTGRFRWY